MKYRKEIDGLRAVAVVPVVLFHAGLKSFGGGYLGVDVFFVISGYLISTIILDDIRLCRFSVLDFYERRFLRILPAYVAMILAASVLAWVWMMPDELRNFGQSVFASSAFSSNILFWTEASYFMPGSAEKPLLHTWSLSVEEQFYLFFPLLLVALSRLRWRWTVIVIAAASIVSLGMAEYGWRHCPWANFYMLPFRAWELGLGALSAFYLRVSGAKSNGILAGAGLGALLASMAFFSEATPVPSIYALVPVLGTVLIVVFAAPGNWVGRLLSHKYLVFIGLISYSTYLWHQPLLAFARIRSVPSASPLLLASMALASFVIGYLSWRYIESPFRKGGPFFSWPRQRVLATGVSALAVLSVMGLAAHFAHGFPSRVPERAVALAAFVDDKSPLENEEKCAFFGARPLVEHPVPGCDSFLKSGRADVIFIGDSHSGALSYDAQIALAKEGIPSYSLTYSGCLGLRGFTHLGMPVGYDCIGYNDSMIKYAHQVGAKVVVITSRFPLYLLGTRFDNGEGGVEPGHQVNYERAGVDQGGVWRNLTPEEHKHRMLDGFSAELQRLSGEFAVVLLDPIPEAGWNVPQLAARIAFFRNEKDINVSTDYAAYEARSRDVIAAFDSVKSSRIYRVKPQEILCNSVLPGRCINANGKEAYYFDNNHLSRTGARLIVPKIVAAVHSALGR